MKKTHKEPSTEKKSTLKIDQPDNSDEQQNVDQIDSKKDVLNHFLKTDMQEQEEWITIILEVVQELEQGKRCEWSMPMNFYELSLTSEKAIIESSYSEVSNDSVELPLQHFKTALTRWADKIADLK